MALILASGSPRRRELMGLLRIPFTVWAADVDETMDPGRPPEEETARLSLLKARSVPRGPDDVVVAADTIVVSGGKVLGKPRSEAEAFEMLTMLSGGAHRVMTGLTVLRGDQAQTVTEITRIWFRPLPPGEIRAYIRTGEPMDKAGAYGIQGGAALFVRRLEGDYYNVVGLPVCRLVQLLRRVAPALMEDTL